LLSLFCFIFLIRCRSFCLLYDLYKLQYDNSMNKVMTSSISGEIIILSIACARVKIFWFVLCDGMKNIKYLGIVIVCII
jgi:hypothetical protein